MVQYRIKSKFLTAITEMTKKLSLTEDGVTATSPAMDDDGNFVTDIETDKELHLQNMAGVDVEKKDEPQTKEELMAQAVEKFKSATDIISEFDELLKKINKADEEETSDAWEVNEEQNDVYLQSKDAHIFQQNGNILLSHDGMVEIFKTVDELHKWLQENGYPMPPAVEIYESTDEQALKILED